MEVVHPPKLLLNMPSHQIGHRSSLALSVFRKGRLEADLCLTWMKFDHDGRVDRHHKIQFMIDHNSPLNQ